MKLPPSSASISSAGPTISSVEFSTIVSFRFSLNLRNPSSIVFLIQPTVTSDGSKRPISKTDQIRMCGNSVCPQVAAAIVKANYAEQDLEAIPPLEFTLEAAE